MVPRPSRSWVPLVLAAAFAAAAAGPVGAQRAPLLTLADGRTVEVLGLRR